MKKQTCPICRLRFSGPDCPDCHVATPEEQDAAGVYIDGAVVNDSWTACAAKVRLNFPRFLWYRLRILVYLWLSLTFFASLFVLLQWWIPGTLALLLLAAFSGLLFWARGKLGQIYHSALLTPGMVVSTTPLEFIALAEMGNGPGSEATAIKRVAVDFLPNHPVIPGSTFPCVSHFQEGPRSDRWGDFDAHPLSFGTGNIRVIEARTRKLGEEAFARLKQAHREGKFPAKAGDLFWLSGANTTPPPLPTPPPPLPRSEPPPLPGR